MHIQYRESSKSIVENRSPGTRDAYGGGRCRCAGRGRLPDQFQRRRHGDKLSPPRSREPWNWNLMQPCADEVRHENESAHHGGLWKNIIGRRITNRLPAPQTGGMRLPVQAAQKRRLWQYDFSWYSSERSGQRICLLHAGQEFAPPLFGPSQRAHAGAQAGAGGVRRDREGVEPVLTEEQRRAWNAAAAKVRSRPRLWQSGPLSGETFFTGI